MLTALVLIPLFAGLLCWLVKPRWLMEAINVASFGATLCLGIALATRVLEHRVVTDDAALTRARLALCQAARIVLRNGFTVLGISAPEQM